MSYPAAQLISLPRRSELGNLQKKKEGTCAPSALSWLRGLDSNQQPSGYEPDELPVAPPRCHNYTTPGLLVQVEKRTNAEGGTRTRTEGVSLQRILSPSRLPIPPPRHAARGLHLRQPPAGARLRLDCTPCRRRRQDERSRRSLVERATGFEPATFCMASRRSTAELRPRVGVHCKPCPPACQVCRISRSAPSSSSN
jgi:hypothetical protein